MRLQVLWREDARAVRWVALVGAVAWWAYQVLRAAR